MNTIGLLLIYIDRVDLQLKSWDYCGQLWVWHIVCGQTCDGLYHFTQKSTTPILALKLSVSATITPGGLPHDYVQCFTSITHHWVNVHLWCVAHRQIKVSLTRIAAFPDWMIFSWFYIWTFPKVNGNFNVIRFCHFPPTLRKNPTKLCQSEWKQSLLLSSLPLFNFAKLPKNWNSVGTLKGWIRTGSKGKYKYLKNKFSPLHSKSASLGCLRWHMKMSERKQKKFNIMYGMVCWVSSKTIKSHWHRSCHNIWWWKRKSLHLRIVT